jgi:hypothetical protein
LRSNETVECKTTGRAIEELIASKRGARQRANGERGCLPRHHSTPMLRVTAAERMRDKSRDRKS